MCRFPAARRAGWMGILCLHSTACQQNAGGFNLDFCSPEMLSLPRYHLKGNSLGSLPTPALPCAASSQFAFSCKSTQLHWNSAFQMEKVGNGLDWLILASGDSESPKFQILWRSVSCWELALAQMLQPEKLQRRESSWKTSYLQLFSWL